MGVGVGEVNIDNNINRKKFNTIEKARAIIIQ